LAPRHPRSILQATNRPAKRYPRGSGHGGITHD
jgi:hypothetical protein